MKKFIGYSLLYVSYFIDGIILRTIPSIIDSIVLWAKDRPVDQKVSEETEEVNQDRFIIEVAVPKATRREEEAHRLKMGSWLRENIGTQTIQWDYKIKVVRDEKNHDVFLFLNEEDAMAFKLTWL